MQCDKCNSDNIQKLEMVYESGTHRISTTSDTSGEYGGRTETSGSSQSALSARASPPAKKTYSEFVIFLIIPGFLCLSSKSYTWNAVGVALGVFGIYLVCSAVKYNFGTYHSLYGHWKESWLCHKCGNIYHRP